MGTPLARSSTAAKSSGNRDESPGKREAAGAYLIRMMLDETTTVLLPIAY